MDTLTKTIQTIHNCNAQWSKLESAWETLFEIYQSNTTDTEVRRHIKLSLNAIEKSQSELLVMGGMAKRTLNEFMNLD